MVSWQNAQHMRNNTSARFRPPHPYLPIRKASPPCTAITLPKVARLAHLPTRGRKKQNHLASSPTRQPLHPAIISRTLENLPENAIPRLTRHNQSRQPYHTRHPSLLCIHTHHPTQPTHNQLEEFFLLHAIYEKRENVSLRTCRCKLFFFFRCSHIISVPVSSRVLSSRLPIYYLSQYSGPVGQGGSDYSERAERAEDGPGINGLGCVGARVFAAAK
ncbi:hypothetical protein P153DRAFT_153298 [Dothidotthia symphoricarpi CBS 119687]|uniref:SWIM-type domain-containing protein n=1 Tax=Dothidotthia symphoricarpi CBS 119687 TaxID=1392245 RepID=A0A6A6AN97_9PLEO|nr:uncharacterized protein P153DRAFT_153298 [Dothidotthia symphoricarpi CBS 119687]KAF2133260.1 hypothetical protein P153DRAFT_153298 [Dothidotthia symphoricarpi CBS 119687]